MGLFPSIEARTHVDDIRARDMVFGSGSEPCYVVLLFVA